MQLASAFCRLCLLAIGSFMLCGCGARTDFACVLFVVDVSESIPLETWTTTANNINQVASSFRTEHDRVGVITFGTNARFEVPVAASDTSLAPRFDSHINGNASNLSEAIELATQAFPNCDNRRIVVISDGNETTGDAIQAAQQALDKGIAFDVIPVRYDRLADVSITDVTTAAAEENGADVKVNVHLQTRVTNAFQKQAITGRLRVIRNSSQSRHLVSESDVQLASGATVVSVTDSLDQVEHVRYTATFIPDEHSEDANSQNNTATTTIAHDTNTDVLFVENVNNLGAFGDVIDKLVVGGITLEKIDSAELPRNLAEYQDFRCVILADVPHTPATATRLKVLTESVKHGGCGLVALGGLHSFGQGGWEDTELEDAMPVACQSGGGPCAIVLLNDLAYSPEASHWQKEIAATITKGMIPNSKLGILTDGGTRWAWGEPHGLVQVGSRKNMMLARLGSTSYPRVRNIDGAMKKALAQLQDVNSMPKMLVIVTNQSQVQPSDATMKALIDAQIKVSIVYLSHGGASNSSAEFAKATGGRYYLTKDPRTIINVARRELTDIQVPPVFSTSSPSSLTVQSKHPIFDGVPQSFPGWQRFVVTKTKEKESFDTPIASQDLSDSRYSTILATRSYGRGRVVALTADLSLAEPAVSGWSNPEDYNRFLGQMVTWTMRPKASSSKCELVIERKDRSVELIVRSSTERSSIPDALTLQGVVVSPSGTSTAIELTRLQDQRFSATVPIVNRGSYSAVVKLPNEQASLTSEFQINDLGEHRRLKTNKELLTKITALSENNCFASWDTNPFRRTNEETRQSN